MSSTRDPAQRASRHSRDPVMTAAPQAAVSRNEPCPCGSGKRFKDCHGSLAAGPEPAPVPPHRSRYRAPASEWAGLGAEDCDRLGTLMEQAIRHQREQRMRDAERLYRAVLEEAPRTHDALHMLGVVRLGLGDFTDAERLIRSAMLLRPRYAAIESNWALVRQAIASRDRHGVETLCEHALPLLFPSMDQPKRPEHAAFAAHRGPARALHIVGTATHPGSESAWITRRLTELLASFEPVLWHASDAPTANGPWQQLDRHVLDAATGRHPQDGCVLLTSVECDTDSWLRNPVDRVLVFMQSAAPSAYLERLRRIAADGARAVTLVFESHAVARRFGRDEYVVPPPVDLAEFADATAATRVRRPASALNVATVGQDGRSVVIADDRELLQAIAAGAGRLSVLDPGPLRYDLGMIPAVHCVARGEQSLAQFVGDADLYLHRARPWWTEGQGRALFGAMALGVPVLCPRRSIYAEYIDDGIDGWLFEDRDGALATIDALRADRSRLPEAGRAARLKATRVFDPVGLARAYRDVVQRWMQPG
jgi:glycosyltransferase involved in cell wall biosynthesis